MWQEGGPYEFYRVDQQYFNLTMRLCKFCESTECVTFVSCLSLMILYILWLLHYILSSEAPQPLCSAFQNRLGRLSFAMLGHK